MSKEDSIKLLQTTLNTEKLSKIEIFRIQSVLLRKKGYSRDTIKDITGKSASSIEDWITLFNKKGIEGLKDHPPLNPNTAKLTYEQKDEIKEILNTKTPEDLGFSGEFWNPHVLKDLVKQKFKIVYKSDVSYLNLLHYSGLSYQKVEFKDKRKNDELSKEFKKNYKMKLKKGVLKMSW